MSKAIIADNRSKRVHLNKGQEYYLCVCGRSGNQPFCDGSHAGTGFEPLTFQADRDGEVKLCMCKHSSNLPFCDGTHNRFSRDQVGKEGP